MGFLSNVDVPFTVIKPDELPASTHAGDPGEALWRTIELGGVRIRRVT